MQSATAPPPALELSPDLTFVLHLDTHARPPRHAAGRIEHVTSGRIAHFTSLAELLAFLAEVVRDQVDPR